MVCGGHELPFMPSTNENISNQGAAAFISIALVSSPTHISQCQRINRAAAVRT